MSTNLINTIRNFDVLYRTDHAEFYKPKSHIWETVARQCGYQDPLVVEAEWMAFCYDYSAKLKLSDEDRPQASFVRYPWLDAYVDQLIAIYKTLATVNVQRAQVDGQRGNCELALMSHQQQQFQPMWAASLDETLLAQLYRAAVSNQAQLIPQAFVNPQTLPNTLASIRSNPSINSANSQKRRGDEIAVPPIIRQPPAQPIPTMQQSQPGFLFLPSNQNQIAVTMTQQTQMTRFSNVQSFIGASQGSANAREQSQNVRAAVNSSAAGTQNSNSAKQRFRQTLVETAQGMAEMARLMTRLVADYDAIEGSQHANLQQNSSSDNQR